MYLCYRYLCNYLLNIYFPIKGENRVANFSSVIVNVRLDTNYKSIIMTVGLCECSTKGMRSLYMWIPRTAAIVPVGRYTKYSSKEH